MVSHLAAFFKAAVSGTLLPLSPIQDDCLTTAGFDLTVPELNHLVAALIFGDTPVDAQIQAPSLRRYIQEDITSMLALESCVNAKDNMIDLRDNPLVLDVAEKLNVLTQHTLDGHALIWLADGPIVPVKGAIHTIEGALAAPAVADVWTPTALTLGQTLPAGRYQVVGARAYGANLLAVRLIFTGEAWRAGVPAGAVINEPDIPMFRKGNFGVLGEFEFDQPPRVESLAHTAAGAGVIALDIIQIRAGR